MDAVFKALSDDHRRAILRLVADEELTAGAIAGNFDISRPAVSQHLAVLRTAGLLDERRDGTRRLYRARPAALAELRVFLDEFWGSALARLKYEVEIERRRHAMIRPVDRRDDKENDARDRNDD